MPRTFDAQGRRIRGRPRNISKLAAVGDALVDPMTGITWDTNTGAQVQPQDIPAGSASIPLETVPGDIKRGVDNVITGVSNAITAVENVATDLGKWVLLVAVVYFVVIPMLTDHSE